MVSKKDLIIYDISLLVYTKFLISFENDTVLGLFRAIYLYFNFSILASFTPWVLPQISFCLLLQRFSVAS